MFYIMIFFFWFYYNVKEIGIFVMKLKEDIDLCFGKNELKIE